MGNELKMFDERRSVVRNRPLEMHKWNVYFSGDDKELGRAERNCLKMSQVLEKTLFKPKVNEVELAEVVSLDVDSNVEFVEALSRGNLPRRFRHNTRQRHKELRNEHKIVESAIICGDNGDIRPLRKSEIRRANGSTMPIIG
ncbi:hypothetical protein CVS40_3616 [Lucilia cuprina]|nr:hypothetical protein CVS40_3616 [Lucilia cuprina]